MPEKSVKRRCNRVTSITRDAAQLKPKTQLDTLKGWQQIAIFLGLPISAAEPWAKSGMPVTRIGRRVQASPEEPNRWLGHEVTEPVHIATKATDLSAELKRGLSYLESRGRCERTRKRRSLGAIWRLRLL